MWVQAAVEAAEKAGREASVHARQLQERLGEEASRSCSLDARISELVASRSVMEAELVQQKASEAGLKKQLDAVQSELSKLKVVLKQEAARADAATGSSTRLQVRSDSKSISLSAPGYRLSASKSTNQSLTWSPARSSSASCTNRCSLRRWQMELQPMLMPLRAV